MPGSASAGLSDTPVPLKESAPASGDRFAAGLRGFGPPGILAILVILAGGALSSGVAAILVLVWARLSRTPWREIGYVRPRSWIGGVAVGVVLGAAFKLLMKTIVMPLLGADPINHAYHYLAGNRGAVVAFLPSLILAAGFAEETFYRGYPVRAPRQAPGAERRGPDRALGAHLGPVR